MELTARNSHMPDQDNIQNRLKTALAECERLRNENSRQGAYVPGAWCTAQFIGAPCSAQDQGNRHCSLPIVTRYRADRIEGTNADLLPGKPSLGSEIRVKIIV